MIYSLKEFLKNILKGIFLINAYFSAELNWTFNSAMSKVNIFRVS